jgi:hypothetical protein
LIICVVGRCDEATPVHSGHIGQGRVPGPAGRGLEVPGSPPNLHGGLRERQSQPIGQGAGRVAIGQRLVGGSQIVNHVADHQLPAGAGEG